MALQKHIPSSGSAYVSMKPLSFPNMMPVNAQHTDPETSHTMEPDIDIDLREVYFLIMHFLSMGPCQRTYGQFWNELLEHQLLPRRYHAQYSRRGVHSGDENDDGMSFPLSYTKLMERYPHIEKDHLVKLFKQLVTSKASLSKCIGGGNAPNAADVPTLLGTGSFSLLSYDRDKRKNEAKLPPVHMRWPHIHADQVRGLSLREIGGGFTRHHRAPSSRAACYAIAKPCTMVQKMRNIKRLRGHRNAVYCAIFDRSGRYVITGSDDRLVKIWSMETAYCLASCRGHEGDITDLAVSSNNAFVASSSNDCIIRVWRLPDGLPISVLRGHTGAVTAIAFSPRPGSPYQLLSSSDDGTCRIWDARNSQFSPRIYVPRPSDSLGGKNGGPSSSNGQQSHQIFCCAFNANGTVFVTGSSDTLARVWNACKSSTNDSNQPNHEIDLLPGHENDVNYVQFSGCAVASRFCIADYFKEENVPKFKNSWFSQDSIVTCSRDGSAIIWIPRSRRSHGKNCRWTRAYHLKVPPPPMPPQPPRGGPRQRILPTPRGVNMIVWSLDNRFVLAAIMDCRICVWNAADGSLLHSLTGHTESTYVLDVHPFNPRIAMSAGYDGKMIVWDIWEGTPIQIYEISRFKLVDGKFSSDGTSIILSDDVGQLYIINTGQGESQKDAKYDQFYLGDYRPLIQDTYGNVLDQETQLTPYRRNMEDPLCDSALIPYPEPYQTMFQQRRLGALGKEWRPSFLKLAVGPDITLDQHYQMPPLADLDLVIDPLPEYIDTMDWEPENEVQTDDTDSEYNVTEEYSTGAEQGSLSCTNSGDSECSADDGDIEGTNKDALRRSKRKTPKTEIMTSSGRRVKRRNLDECDGTASIRNRSRKSRNGRKAARMRSSTSKSSRPQRTAARNARSFFSQITGTFTDAEDEDGLEGDFSGSESTMQDSNIDSDESGRSSLNEQSKHLKGKDICRDELEDAIKCHDPESRNAGNRRRLVLKLPIRDSKKLMPPESTTKCDNRDDLAGSSSNAPLAATGNSNMVSSLEDYCSGDPNCRMVDRGRRQLDKLENQLDLLEGYKNGEIRWGGVKARTSKRMKLGEAMSSDACTRSDICLDHKEKENSMSGGSFNEIGAEKSMVLNEVPNCEEHTGLNEYGDLNKSPKGAKMSTGDTIGPIHSQNGHPPELKASLAPVSTKFRLRSKRTPRDPQSPFKLKIKSLADDQGNGGRDAPCDCSSDMNCNAVLEAPRPDGHDRIEPVHGSSELRESDVQVDENCTSTVHDSLGSQSQSKKMYDVVYRRSKLHKDRTNSEGDASGTGESNRSAHNHIGSPEASCLQATTNRSHTMLSNGLKALASVPNLISQQIQELDGSYRDAKNSSAKRCQTQHNELGSSSRTTVGLRSTRNRRTSYYFHDSGPVDRRKSYQSSGKGSWLMLSTHEEGSRYIPQKGDDIVYLRQGHQEYMRYSCLREVGPWTSINGDIRAVEFCKAEDLEYSTLPGSGDSCCKMTLKFVDPTSSVFNKSFKLTLPEVTGFPDFLVERTRYDAAIKRKWTCRDKCRVWWKNEGEKDGSWWDGRILFCKPKSSEFPDSPWEAYTIRYKSDPTDTQLHSPWELFDADTQWEQPCIDDESRNKLLSAFAKLELSGGKVQDPYGVQKLKQVSHKSSFTNRFPVPLSLELIQSRLENNYYRSLEALKHDISVMLSNAESYFGKNAELKMKLIRLSDWFQRTLSSL